MQTLILVLLLLCLSAFADEVVLLDGRDEASDARDMVLTEKTKELRYATFILELDEQGQKTLGQLVNQALSGTKVMLMIDGVGSPLAKEPALLSALENLGVDVRLFNPMFRNPLNINNRSHAKVVITDNTKLNGGRNTTKHYYHEFIDIEVLVRGESVKDATLAFDNVFNYAPQVKKPVTSFVTEAKMKAAREKLLAWAGSAKNIKHTRVIKPQKVDSIVYVSDPPYILDKQSDGINKRMIAYFDRAKESLDLLNPYFLPPPPVVDAMERALNRGVKISVGTNASATTDSTLAGIAWDIKKKQLVNMGLEIYESSRYVHAKSGVRDGIESFVGSVNLDWRSYFLNLENGDFITSKDIATDLTNHHRRVRNTFMTPITHETLKNAPKANCLMNGYYEILTHLAYPHL